MCWLCVERKVFHLTFERSGRRLGSVLTRLFVVFLSLPRFAMRCSSRSLQRIRRGVGSEIDVMRRLHIGGPRRSQGHEMLERWYGLRGSARC